MIDVYGKKELQQFDRGLEGRGLLGEAISRAGFCVYMLSLHLLGSPYGKRIVILYGPGNNGRDALVAGELLIRAGSVVRFVGYQASSYADPASYEGVDLVIDGCFGVGIKRAFTAPPLSPQNAVLAIDVPSGLDADTGKIAGEAMCASATLSLTGLKVGALIGEGPRHCGAIYTCELGIGSPVVPDGARAMIEDADLQALVGLVASADHKWSHSLAVFSGSPGMTGAANLVCLAAALNGAGIVHLFTDALDDRASFPTETVVHVGEMRKRNFEEKIVFFRELAERFKAVAIGPGLGKGSDVTEVVEAALACRVPLVLDADGISAIPSVKWLRDRMASEGQTVVLTPHAGELSKLVERSSEDLAQLYQNLDAVRFAEEFSSRSGVILLVKGSPTIVSSPQGKTFLTTAPTSSLAVAGSGDVLTGMIGASLTMANEPLSAVALTAHLHGLAGRSLVRGRSGELPYHARDIFTRLESMGSGSRNRSLERPTLVEGGLVACSTLLA